LNGPGILPWLSHRDRLCPVARPRRRFEPHSFTRSNDAFSAFPHAAKKLAHFLPRPRIWPVRSRFPRDNVILGTGGDMLSRTMQRPPAFNEV